MSDISKLTLLDNQTYDLKDSIAREHIQNHNNPHQVTAEQAGAISRISDYSFRKVSGWYRFLTINISAGQSNSIWLLVQDTYSSGGGAESYKAIISFYITRTSSGGFSSSAYFLTGYGFTKDRFHYTYDSSSGDVSIYVYKNTNNNGAIGVTVISSLNRSGSYVDLSDNFESTAISTLPEGGWRFNAMQDGAGNIIPDTYATKDELLSTVINKNDIGSSTDIDTLTAPGMWYSSTGLQPNWPNRGKPGRLVVFGSTSATNSRKVQLVVCNTNNVDDAEFYYRIGIGSGSSSTWGSWTCVATKADLEYSTDEVTGDIVTFETESAQVLPSVVVDIEPVQDLHGYDHPWPAGGGKNLFSGWETITTSQAISYKIPVDFTSNTYYTVSGLTADHPSWIWAYDNNNAFVGRTSGQYIAALTVSKTSFSSGDGTKDYDSISYIILQYYNWTDITRDAVEALPTQFEIGDTATSFAPYSNICPISGWDGCKVERTGKNLFDKTQTMLKGYFINADGEIQAHNYYQVSDYIKVSPSTAYSFSGTITNDVTNAVAFFDSNKTFISRYLPGAVNVPSQFTTPVDCAFIRFNWSNISSQLDTIQLERGSSASTYEPYSGTTYSISFPSSAGTVYGGTLDVTNGLLTVDRAMVDLGTLTWGYSSSYAFFYAGLDDAKKPSERGGNPIGCCSIYRLVSTPGTNIFNNLPDKSIAYNDIGYSNTSRVLVKDTSYLDDVTFKAAMSGVQLVYELVTPQTYHLTPTQITAFLGQNNLWADTGDVSVVYREGKNALLQDVADAVRNFQPKLLFDSTPAEGSTNPVTSDGIKTALDTKVDDNVIATVEPTSTASEYHGSGDPFMFNGNLYQASGNIAEGETIVPGTNAYPTNAVQYANFVGETLYEDFNGRINDLDASVDGLIADKIYFGKSTTAAATQTKTCSITGISSYYDGLMVRIWFTTAQTYNGTPKLNINGLGAKDIDAVRYEWAANSIVDMVFDNSSDSWRIVRGGKATTTYYGLTKLSSSVSSTSTALAATPSAVKTAYDRANTVAADLATVEATSTASTSYAVGEHLMLGGVLYEVTAAIAVGETIAQGTNVTPVTVMASMKAMDVRLSNELAESNAVAFGIPYEGVDLTVKFADEISQYSDPWDWIHNRIAEGNWTGLHIGDYIPFTTTEASQKTYQAQIAGINTYKNYGDTAVGNHIDFICRELWATRHPMNPVNFNNGTKFGDAAATEYPWLASDLYHWLNSLGGTVPNATTAGGGTGELVDYTTSGVWYYLPAALQRQIVEKRVYLPKRYSSSGLLSDDNAGDWVDIGWLWLPSEFEVYGAPVWGGKGGFATAGNCVQYPIFANSMNRIKYRNGSRDSWWLLSTYSGNATSWCTVYYYGYAYSSAASYTLTSVPVCFRIK